MILFTKESNVCKCFVEKNALAVFVVVQMIDVPTSTTTHVALEAIVLSCICAESFPVWSL